MVCSTQQSYETEFQDNQVIEYEDYFRFYFLVKKSKLSAHSSTQPIQPIGDICSSKCATEYDNELQNMDANHTTTKSRCFHFFIARLATQLPQPREH